MRSLALVGAVALLATAAETATASYGARVDNGTLRIIGDGASDRLVLRLHAVAPNVLQVDVGADGTPDFSFDRTTFTAIHVIAGGGNDDVRLDLLSGTFTDEALTIEGGGGNDVLHGGFGADRFDGGSGDDVVNPFIGTDVVRLGDGDDRATWAPGDGSDTVDGGGGADALDFTAGAAGDDIDLTARGGRVRLSRTVANVVMDLDLERVNLRPAGGPDTVTVNDLTGSDLELVDVRLESGLDADTVIARGTNGSDRVDVGASEGGVLVDGMASRTRVADAGAADRLLVEAGSGADTITGRDGIPGPGTVAVDGGDGSDRATYVGTSARDRILLTEAAPAVGIESAAGTARFETSAVEDLAVLGLAGADEVRSFGNLGALTRLTIDGGPGGDALFGGNGDDRLLGADGNDFVDGQQGGDTALLGAGDDRFVWDPGDASDLVEGQSGDDALDLNGSNIGERIDVTANEQRVQLFRDIGFVAMDVAGFERLGVRALGGADAIAVGHLGGTGVRTVDVDLRAVGGSGDAQGDDVLVRGTNRADDVDVAGDGPRVLTRGLPAEVRIDGAERAGDFLVVQALGGDDEVIVAPSANDLIGQVVMVGADG